MFDTMTTVKAFGWLCGALLAYLLVKWAAEEIYHTGGHGHGDHHEQAYSIDTGADDHSGDQDDAEPEIDVAAVLAAGDAGKGEKVFGKCKSCHKLEAGANGTGPYLLGVVGRDIGAAEGYAYSGKLVEQAEVWTAENLFAFLESPKDWAPGTKMKNFAGLKKPTDRANVIAYLESLPN